MEKQQTKRSNLAKHLLENKNSVNNIKENKKIPKYCEKEGNMS